MIAVGYVLREFAALRRHLDGIVRGLTVDELVWSPPGTANAIGATLIHLLSGEDRLVQTVLQRKPTLWDTGRWAEQIGVAALPVRGHDWGGVDLLALNLGTLLAYTEAVQQATARYLATLTDADLDTIVDVYGQEQPRAEALISIVIHNVSHAGEIAALKGLQGKRGRTT
jgi:hypothetical protein